MIEDRAQRGGGVFFGLAIVAAVVLAFGCRPVVDPPPPATSNTQLEDDLHLDLSEIDTTSWVRTYDPRRSAGGVNLVLYRRRLPLIVDMNGRIVHSWPAVRAVGRARLDRNGSLSVIGTDNLIKEYDWEGNLLWKFSLQVKADLLHHDFRWLENGHLLVLANDVLTRADYLLEVDRDGKTVWQWRFDEHRDQFPGWDEQSGDPTHANSVFELPPNQWYEAGDQRFRPGNILVSARNLNTVFVISKKSGEVVWKLSDGLDHQHEALMVGDGQHHAGLILLFNNGLQNLYGQRRSRVQKIDPVSGDVIWRYGAELFYSSVGGTAQALPGGNIGITSSQGGRVFEVTWQRKIVWEWVPPYLPIRTERLATDHCPQLASLELQPPVEVSQSDGFSYVDLDKYRFGFKREVSREMIAGVERDVLSGNELCRVLRIPPDAVLGAGFGIRSGEAGGSPLTGRFQIDIRNGSGHTTLVDATVSVDREGWDELSKIALDRYAYESVRLCLTATVVSGDEKAAERLVWGNPAIVSKSMRPVGELAPRRITQKERSLEERQLEALGYVE